MGRENGWIGVFVEIKACYVVALACDIISPPELAYSLQLMGIAGCPIHYPGIQFERHTQQLSCSSTNAPDSPYNQCQLEIVPRAIHQNNNCCRNGPKLTPDKCTKPVNAKERLQDSSHRSTNLVH